MKRTLIWIGALVVGAVLGLLGINWLNEVMNVVATIYTIIDMVETAENVWSDSCVAAMVDHTL